MTARSALPVWLAQLKALALDYHKTWGEGEYGCPGQECPGVKRLVRLLLRGADLVQACPPAEEVAHLALDLVREIAGGECPIACGQCMICRAQWLLVNPPAALPPAVPAPEHGK